MNGVWILIILSTFNQIPGINVSRFNTIEGCQAAGQATIAMLDQLGSRGETLEGRRILFRCVLDDKAWR